MGGFLIKFTYKLMLLCVFLFSILLLLLGTNLGLDLTVSLIAGYIPGKLKLKGLEGQVLSGFSVKRLIYDYKDMHLRISNVIFSWDSNYKFYIKPEVLSLKTPTEVFKPKFKTLYIDPKAMSVHCEMDQFIFDFRLTEPLFKFWKLSGSVNFPKSTLNFQGKGVFSPFLKGKIFIKGENLPIISSDDYKIEISPNLTLALSAKTKKLTGNILIPQALISPKTFTKSQTLSDDVVFVGEKKKATFALPFDADINIQMGDKVEVLFKGLQGFLKGKISVKQLLNEPLIANGELQLVNGSYTMQDKKLDIEQAQLILNGSNLDNPKLYLRAYKIYTPSSAFSGTKQLADFKRTKVEPTSKIRVGVELTGFVKNPNLHLFSVPANLSQADIFSILILDKPANQASEAHGELLLAAVSALNLHSSSKSVQLLKQLKQNIGVDFSVESSKQFDKKTNQDKNQTSLVLGKALSKRLYLSYNMALSQVDNSVLTLSYLISQVFSLQIDASKTGNGIDFLYTHNKD